MPTLAELSHRRPVADATIPLLRPFMPPEVTQGLPNVLESGWIGEGPRVKEFEEALVPYIGTRRITCVNSGTSAISLALHLAGVDRGDEVITTPMTCAATNLPILHRGAIPRWADIGSANGLIDPASVEELITSRTRAILCVDWLGCPCNYDELTRIAAKHSLPLIADCAQSLGATYKSRFVSALADFSCFSFQAVKTITTGDGGALTTQSDPQSERAKRLRWFGIDRQVKHQSPRPWEYDIVETGYKYHMNDIAAYIGLCQLKYLDQLIHLQRDNAAYFSEYLRNLDGIELLDPPEGSHSSYWLYGLLVRRRDAFIGHMMQHNIQVCPVHQSNLKLSIFKNGGHSPPHVKQFDERLVCIPNGYWVSRDDRERIVHRIRCFSKSSQR